jgi:hypothetical protein
MKLLITMGVPVKDIDKAESGYGYQGAETILLDWDKKISSTILTYESPAENLGKGLSMMFKGAFVENGMLYIVTNTEVLKFDLNKKEILDVLTSNTFNDLHGVFVKENAIYVCNTGLEIVQKFIEGCLVAEWNLATPPTWERFDRNYDYRKSSGTKPHEAHINHVFELNGDPWVNLGGQCRAQNVLDSTQFIDLKECFEKNERVLCHDGIVRGDFIYFTAVNGLVIIVDKETKKVVKKINLHELNNIEQKVGWTRGIEVIGNRAFIGITRARKSKYKEYTKWMLGMKKQFSSSIIEIDIETHKFISFYEIENGPANGIYTILNVTDCIEK